MSHEELAEQLVKTCLKKGADAAEVYIQDSRNLRISVRNGEIETIQESAGAGAGFRVFVKGKMAFSSSNDLRPESLDGAVLRAVEFAGITTADPNNALPGDRGTTPVGGLHDPGISAVPMEDKIVLAIKTEKLAMSSDPRITKSGGASYGEGESDVFLANSNGLLKGYKTSTCAFGVSVVAEKGEQKAQGYESCSRRFFSDLKPAEDVAAKAARDAFEMLDPRQVRTQKAAVIIAPDAARSLLGGILAAVDGERVLQGASFLGKKAGLRIGSELITLIDDGTLEKGPASAPFDAEGVPTQKRVIVDKGILRGFLYNTSAARRAGAQSTGNASRSDFSSLPGIGPHNFFLQAGNVDPADIIHATKTGFLVREITGYGINPVNGDFSGGASGLWIEEGRIAFPVKGLTIAGAGAEMLEGIDMVGNDLDSSRQITAPTFRIRMMQIGGE